MADISSGFFYHSLRDLNDRNEDQSSNHESLGLSDLSASKQSSSNYEIRTQSTHLFDDRNNELNRLLSDLVGRTLEVTDTMAETLFPDEAFGFPINSSFISNFQGLFLNAGIWTLKIFAMTKPPQLSSME